MNLKHLKYSFLFIILATCYLVLDTNGFFFGLKSADNTIANITQIETKYSSPEKGKIHIPIIAFIFDPRGPDAINTINHLTGELGTDRIYHITVSPGNLSAKDVAKGKFDSGYNTFFQLIKKNNLRVIFRTMHEMNGGRYQRGSDPTNFKPARIHVRELSRTAGLDTQNILFDMSVNHWDMPTRETPSQTAKLITCTLQNKKIKQCPTFEDYYPGDKYVDIMGFTFYNRGKASYNRERLSPSQIVNQFGRNTLTRLKKIGKPIFIDEVATTAVRYEQGYDAKLSRAKYLTNYYQKNQRIIQLRDLLKKETSILGMIYFNVDYTNGLSEKLIGEVDWSAININNNKVYRSIFDLYKASDQPQRPNVLMGLFNIKLFNYSGSKIFLPSQYISPIKDLIKLSQTQSGNISDFIDRLNLKYLYRRFSNDELHEIKELTKGIIK